MWQSGNSWAVVARFWTPPLFLVLNWRVVFVPGTFFFFLPLFFLFFPPGTSGQEKSFLRFFSPRFFRPFFRVPFTDLLVGLPPPLSSWRQYSAGVMTVLVSSLPVRVLPRLPPDDPLDVRLLVAVNVRKGYVPLVRPLPSRRTPPSSRSAFSSPFRVSFPPSTNSTRFTHDPPSGFFSAFFN